MRLSRVRKSKNEIKVAGGVEEEGQGLSKDQFQQVRRRSKGISVTCVEVFFFHSCFHFSFLVRLSEWF